MKRKSESIKSNVIVPKPKVSFTKYQRSCPFHEKARCGRCFCKHPIREGSREDRCNRANCPFFIEGQRLLGIRKKKHEYYVPRRYKKAVLT